MPGDTSTEPSLRVVELAGLVLAPAGVATGVLYYFGYVREQAFFAYFGIDLGSVGFSSSDFLVRSAGPLFVPVAWLLVLALVATLLHHLMMYGLLRMSSRRQRAVWATATAIAVGLLIFATVGLTRSGEPLIDPVAAPLALGAGAVLVDYVLAAPRLGGHLPRSLAQALPSTRRLHRGLTVSLLLLAIFWGTANVALQRGLTAARAVELSLPVQPQAIVYSRDRLYITGIGVDVSELNGSDAAFEFRYNGLRVIAHTQDRWFLVPAGWRHDNNQTVILLPDPSDTIRVDLAP